MRQQHVIPKTIIDITQIPELKEVCEKDDGVSVGAAVTLNDMKEYLQGLVALLPGEYFYRIMNE